MATVPPAPAARRKRKPIDILTEAVTSVGVPVPYKDGPSGGRIVDAVALLQTAEESVGLQTDSSRKVSYLERVMLVAEELGVEVTEPVPVESAPAAAQAPPASTPAAPAPPARTPPDAPSNETFLGDIVVRATDRMKAAHQARIQTLLQTTGDRLIYGRSNALQILLPYQLAVNVAARALLEANPDLVRFDGQEPRVGELFSACRTKANEDYAYARSKGSRAQGAAGIAGSRGSASSGGGSSSGGGASSSGAGASARISAEQRSVRVAQLPQLIKDASSTAQNARDASSAARVRHEFEKAMTYSEQAEAASAKEQRLRLEYGDSMKAMEKASQQRARVSTNQETANSETPLITGELWSSMRPDLLEKARVVADTMASPGAFKREATMSCDGTLRVSPLDGSIGLEDFVLIKSKFCSDLGHGGNCRCRVPLAAAVILAKLDSGDRITVKALWRQSGGSTSTTGAQHMLDVLIFLPVVAFRRSDSRMDSNEAWAITRKEGGVDYLRLGPMMKALQPAAVLGAASSRCGWSSVVGRCRSLPCLRVVTNS